MENPITHQPPPAVLYAHVPANSQGSYGMVSQHKPILDYRVKLINLTYLIQGKPPAPQVIRAQFNNDPYHTGYDQYGPHGGGLPGKASGVFPEDHFRCMKENKNIYSNYHKAFKKPSDMAMSRFDNEQNVAS